MFGHHQVVPCAQSNAVDIDRPIITGQLYNAQTPPPWSAGEGAHANHPGTLSGLRSQALDGAGYNHWLLDDTPAQLRTTLHSSHAASELSLGELIQHQALSSQRGAWRGTGTELSTQGWGSLRAHQGLLLSSQLRAGSYGSAQGTQMDTQESLAQLNAARDLGLRLNQAAQPAGAQALSTHEPEQALHSLIQDLDPQLRGKHPAQVNGQAAQQADASRQLQDPVPRPARPYLLLNSASALLHASAGDLLSLASQSHSRVSQGDQHESAAHTHAQLAGRHASLYSHSGQLQFKAAAGPVSLQAHSDSLEILADQSIQILSVNAEIIISAKDQIELIGGDSKVTLKGGDIEFSTPGSFEVKSSKHNFLGGGNGEAALPVLPSGVTQIAAAENPLIVTYGLALDFTAAPDDWLPHRLGAGTKALMKAEQIGADSRATEQAFAGPVMTAEPQELNHWVSSGLAWQTHESVEQPEEPVDNTDIMEAEDE